MDKTKFAILVGLLLALFFFVKMDAEASENDVLYTWQDISTGNISAVSKNYKFNIGTDGIFVDTSDVDYTSNNQHANVFSYASGVAEFSFDTGALRSVHVDANDLKYYDGSTIMLTPTITSSLTYTDNGFSTFGTSYFTVTPYILWNGEKYYVDSAGYFEIANMPNLYHFDFSIGAEIDACVYFDALHYDYDVIKTYFGNVTIAVKLNACTYTLKGFSYTTTGEKNIIEKLIESNSILTTINGHAKNIYSRVNSIKTNFDIKMSTFRDDIITYITTLQSTLSDKLDEVIEAITQSYDSSSAEDTNTDLSGSLDSWEAAEGATMNDAKIEVSSYDTSSAFSFAPALVSTLSLVTAFSTGFLNASGEFTTAITVMFSLVFVSVLVGLVRFVRR